MTASTTLATDWPSLVYPLEGTAAVRPVSSQLAALPPVSSILDRAVTTVSELLDRKIPPRQVLLAPFLRESNLGFVYGVRGHGKTWVALLIATILTSGTTTKSWKASKAVPTMLIDGEVDLDETQERLRLLEAKHPSLYILHHQNVFDGSDGHSALDLADPGQQQEVRKMCLDRGIKVLILDNLSSLLRGVSENDGDHWEPIGHWLLDLRRLGIAVIVVHHAGRNHQMRGHSRREDMAHWIMKVEKADSKGPDVTTFTTRFEKYRGIPIEAINLCWEIQRVSADKIALDCTVASDLDIFVQHVHDGVESASEIAELMGVSTGKVSKLAKKAEVAGRIRKCGRKYKPPGEENDTSEKQ